MGAAQPQLKESEAKARPSNGAGSKAARNSETPNVYLHKGAAGGVVPASWSTRFGNRTQRKLKQQQFESRRMVEGALILGIMFLLCMLAGVITYTMVHVAPTEEQVKVSDTEPGSAVESLNDLDQDTAIAP